eukprot:6844728-Prymnesium_polylepis.1
MPPRLCSAFPVRPRDQSNENRGREGLFTPSVGVLRCRPKGLLNGACMPGQTSARRSSSSFPWLDWPPCINDARIAARPRLPAAGLFACAGGERGRVSSRRHAPPSNAAVCRAPHGVAGAERPAIPPCGRQGLGPHQGSRKDRSSATASASPAFP